MTPTLCPLWPQTVELPRAVILDRDGVINVRRINHVTRWEEFTFLPGALSAIAALAALRLPVFVVTNQAIINRGIVTSDVVRQIHERMCAQITAAGGKVTEVVACPHRPDEHCACRKPAPGMILDLIARYLLDPAQCLFIGDSCTDLLAAHAAGCRAALVLTGQGQEEYPQARTMGITDVTVAPDLNALVHQLTRSQPVPGAYIPQPSTMLPAIG